MWQKCCWRDSDAGAVVCALTQNKVLVNRGETHSSVSNMVEYTVKLHFCSDVVKSSGFSLQLSVIFAQETLKAIKQSALYFCQGKFASIIEIRDAFWESNRLVR